MKVHHGVEDTDIQNPVVTIGSFDGVHLGHLRVIRHLQRKAAAIGGQSVIISFEPHPREVLYPREKKPGLLTTLDEKIDRLSRLGVDHLIILPFTLDFARLSYADFVVGILVRRLGVRGLVVGYDHHLGHDRQGNFDHLQALGQQHHFFVEQESAFEENHVNVSSTKIRNALATGDIALVNRFLGYNYSLTGTVVPGQRLGHHIGFPTANIDLPDPSKLLPAIGVYAVRVHLGHDSHPGMLNIGIRPTVSHEGILTREVNIFDLDRDLYGTSLTVEILARVRGEQKFENLAELQAQLRRDKATVLTLLAALPR